MVMSANSRVSVWGALKQATSQSAWSKQFTKDRDERGCGAFRTSRRSRWPSGQAAGSEALARR
eukprot:2204718-Rhodomonas_salina.1